MINNTYCKFGVSAGKKYQIDKKNFFQLTNVLNQITNFTSFLLKNIFLKKISIWYFFPALTPYSHIRLPQSYSHEAESPRKKKRPPSYGSKVESQESQT